MEFSPLLKTPMDIDSFGVNLTFSEISCGIILVIQYLA